MLETVEKMGWWLVAEGQLVLALRGDRDRGGAGGHQDRRVVGRELTVHRSAVEGALHAYAEQQVGGLGRQRRVCLYEAEHRGELRRDHAGALALRAQPDSAGVELDAQVGTLLERVRGLDRGLEVGVTAPIEALAP